MESQTIKHVVSKNRAQQCEQKHTGDRGRLKSFLAVLAGGLGLSFLIAHHFQIQSETSQ